MGNRKNFVVPGGITVDSSTLYVDDPNNRVGIGKTDPDHALDVSGVIKGSNGVITLTTTGEPSSSLADGAIAVDTQNDKFYFRSGSSWIEAGGGGGGGGGSLTVSTTAPTSPSAGDLWFKSDTGSSFVYYDSFWVEIGATDTDLVTTTVAAKGDLIVATGVSSVERLGAGSDGQALVADSSAPTGLSWSSVADVTASGAQTLTNKTIDLDSNTVTGTLAEFNTAVSDADLVSLNGTETLTNKTLSAGILVSPEELWSVSATVATGTVNVDLQTAAAFYYTGSASANWTFNFRGNSSTTLSSMLDVGYSITVAFGVTNGATPYRATAFTIDGSSVTPKWQGGSAPSAGNANSIDMYMFTIAKTAATPTYVVFASFSKFA